ncbi:MAG: HEAT repeat domain-containing protein [Chloroflexi bacterium]|nr:HEAT repeat domain-containing protein [Chloroflexota bacterium]
MKLEALLQGISAPTAETRLNVVQVLGMVEETRALNVLRDRFAIEPDGSVKTAIQWAGKKIHQASQSGYSTVNEIFRFFGIDREIANLVDPREAELLRRMQTSMDNALIKANQDAAGRKVGTAAALGIGAALVGGPLMGGMVMAGAMAPSADAASSSMGPVRDQLSTQRTPPPRPSDVNIAVWLKRLREDPNRDNRKSAAIELANFNNPTALPQLATAMLNDPDLVVRSAAEQYGKVLYWKMIYWEMEQDGTLEQEFKVRAKAAGKDFEEVPLPTGGTGPLAPSKSEPPPMPQPNKDDIAQILARAEAERAKRKKR